MSLFIVLHSHYIISFTFTLFFFFQAEDGIRDLVRSRGLGDVYKRQSQRGSFAELRHAEIRRHRRERIHRQRDARRV